MTESNKKYDVVLVGGGPAGYVGAIRAAQLGASVCLIESNKLGGTCLNVGCIPTKALYESAHILQKVLGASPFGIDVETCKLNFPKVMERKQQIVNQLVAGIGFLVKKNKIQLIEGTATFLDAKTIKVSGKSEMEITGDKIIIATGSSNATPPIPGINGKDVIDSTGALELKAVPKRLLIIGGGVIGCEFADIYRSFGSEVVIVEVLPALVSGLDKELSKKLAEDMQKRGIRLYLNSKVKEIRDNKAVGKTVLIETKDGEILIDTDIVLVTTGRKPNTSGLGLEKTGIELERGYIKTDDYLQTNIPGVYGAGDVIGRDMLAHTAYEEATIAVENALGARRIMDYKAVPKVVFTYPEIASAGMSEEEACNKNLDVIVSKVSLHGNGKALIMGESGGFMKIVADKKYNQIIGFHFFGPNASEMIALGTYAIKMESTLEDLRETIFAHPSVSEVVKETVLSALGIPLHS